MFKDNLSKHYFGFIEFCVLIYMDNIYMICVGSCVSDDCDQIKGQINCTHVFLQVLMIFVMDIYVHVYDDFVKM